MTLSSYICSRIRLPVVTTSSPGVEPAVSLDGLGHDHDVVAFLGRHDLPSLEAVGLARLLDEHVVVAIDRDHGDAGDHGPARAGRDLELNLRTNMPALSRPSGLGIVVRNLADRVSGSIALSM